MQIIDKYFPNLSQRQKEQFNNLDTLYREWNAKINVISRKDIDNLYEHHVLHSMAIARIVRFKPSTSILDFGTGGGFPGIPLAILFPECRFRLIDGTGKKVNVAAEIAKAIGLENVEAIHQRGEEEKGKFDFIVSRAVMPMPDLVKIVSRNISRKQHNSIANGILALKGGNLSAELKPYHKIVEVTPISQFFDEEWFREKSVIYLPM
ncbi:MAG: 16S rRNA (guanine(527)-N(7))-methyltransferase RsmG [Prevotella sp.]